MSPAASLPIAPALRVTAPSLASVTAVPPAEPAGVTRISSTSWPPWPSGISSTGRTRTSSTCTPMAITVGAVLTGFVLRRGVRVLPYPRSTTAAITASRWSESSERGSPSIDARQYTVHAHSSSSVSSAAAGTSAARVIAPWLAISAAVRSSSASSTASASSGVPNVAYGATRTVPPSASIP